jgi:hypothetical protein
LDQCGIVSGHAYWDDADENANPAKDEINGHYLGGIKRGYPFSAALPDPFVSHVARFLRNFLFLCLRTFADFCARNPAGRTHGIGILYSAQAVGAMIAAAGLSFTGNIRKKGPLVLWVLALTVSTALYGMSHCFTLSVFFLVMVGATDTFSTILRSTIRQLVTPDHLRGRMGSLNMLFSRGGPQLGNLEAGIVASLIGAPLSVITGGIATVITVAGVAWLVPHLRNYQTNEDFL